jgi:peptide-methionine (R)-S-oxide reductase
MRKHDNPELRERLTPEQYHVTQEAGTEPPFSGEYWDEHDPGTYRCIVCDAPLFTSDTKYDSGTGWPSFWQPISGEAVATKHDFKLIVPRTEVTCGACGAHLGHVFSDGPDPTGKRYCMNSASLRLDRSGE